MSFRRLRPLVLVAFAVALPACGGSSDGALGPATDTDGSVPARPDDAAAANGEHTGTLFLGERGRGRTLDLATGAYTLVPGVRIDESEPAGAYEDSSEVDAMPLPVSGDEFLVTVRGCALVDAPPSEAFTYTFDDTCLALHERGGRQVAFRQLTDSEAAGSGQLSFDGQRIALPLRGGTAEDRVVIADRSLEAVSRVTLPEGSLRTLAWLPDGRLVFAGARTIWVVRPPDRLTPGRLAVFGDDRPDARIDGLAASPDGRYLAFGYLGEIRLIDLLDPEAEVRTLPIAETHGFDDVRAPAWSPDGRHLAVKIYGTGLLSTDLVGRPQEGLTGAVLVVTDAVGIVPVEFGTPGGDGTPITDLHIVRSRIGDLGGRDDPELGVDLSLDGDIPMWWLRGAGG